LIEAGQSPGSVRRHAFRRFLNAVPNPTVEVRECLPDGTEFKAVWSHPRQSGVAKLVTVHFFDRG
jgi:hypothetical protein